MLRGRNKPRAALAREQPRPGEANPAGLDGGLWMAIGPVQLIVLGFNHPDFHGEVIAELERLREATRCG